MSQSWCLTRHRLSCTRLDRSRSHYRATASAASGAGDSNKTSRKKTQVRGASTGSALGGLTIRPLQKSGKHGGQPWSSGILCTEDNCSHKADARTVAWLKNLFEELDTDRYKPQVERHLLQCVLKRQLWVLLHLQGWCHHQERPQESATPDE